jgi:hypothetical protein
MKNTKKSHGEWIDRFHEAVGRHIHVETSDGVIREGRLTGIRARVIRFDDVPSSLPIEVELNGDPTDSISIASLSSISTDNPKRWHG